MKKELEWIRRSPKARTTKSKARIDNFNNIKKKANSKKIKQELHIDVKMGRVGGKILELIKINKSFNELNILNGLTDAVGWSYGLANAVGWSHGLENTVGWSHGLTSVVGWSCGLVNVVGCSHGLTNAVGWSRGLANAVGWSHGLTNAFGWSHGLTNAEMGRFNRH